MKKNSLYMLNIIKEVLLILILFVLFIYLITGVMTYKELLDIVMSKTNGFSTPIFLPKFGWINPAGRGDFREILVKQFNNTDGWLIIRVGNHENIWLTIPQGTDLSKGQWFYWKEKERNIEEDEQTKNSWLFQEFGSYAEIYVKANYTTKEIVVVIVPENGIIYFKRVVGKYETGGCGGGYQALYYYKK